MSQFDPFASTPAASSNNNNAGGGGQSKSSTTNAAADNNNNGTKNPFDIFGSSSTYTNGNNNNQNNQNGGGGMASLMNPFQQFSTTTQQQQQPQPAANANTATSAATTSFWQQSNAVIATAMNPSSPSSMWKTLGGGGGATTASSSSLAASSTTSSSTTAAGMKYKRVVPYTGPIANLESNWDPWLYNATNSNNNNNSNNSVNMTYLIVKANQSCIVPGGVESVLKWMKLHKHANNNGGGKVVMDDLTMNLESKLSLEECGSGGDQQQQLGDYDATTTANYNMNNYTMNNNETNNNNGGGGNKKFGKLFKSGLKKAQASITHSVTSIAIKADGGKNPDWVCASLHYNLGGGEKSNVVVNNNNNNRGMWNAIGGGSGSGGGGGVMGDVCLCKTEWIPLPPPTNFGSGDLEEERGKQISFAVPLCVPDLSFLESSSAAGGGGDIAADNGIVLTVRSLYDNQPNRRRIDRDRIRNSSFILLYLVVLYLNKTSTILPFPPHLLLNILTCSGPVV